MENQRLKLKIPNSLLIEIFGAISSRNFIEELKEYARNNLIKFLTENWRNETVISIVDKLREQSEVDRKTCLDIPLIEKEDSIKRKDYL
jgi:methionine salvage enolase-phosphatase E1